MEREKDRQTERYRQNKTEIARVAMTKERWAGKEGKRKHEIYTNIYEIPCNKSCCSNKIQNALIGEYKKRHFGSMGATQAAEWEREMINRLRESYACEKDNGVKIAEEELYIRFHIKTVMGESKL